LFGPSKYVLSDQDKVVLSVLFRF